MSSPARTIKFIIEKGSTAPKEINKENTIVALSDPETIRLYPEQAKFVYTKFSVHVPTDILTTFLIMPNFKKEGLKIISQSETNTNLRIRLEYVNPTLKTFTLKKNSKIALFMTLNERHESFKKKIEKKKKNRIILIYSINQSINQ